MIIYHIVSVVIFGQYFIIFNGQKNVLQKLIKYYLSKYWLVCQLIDHLYSTILLYSKNKYSYFNQLVKKSVVKNVKNQTAHIELLVFELLVFVIEIIKNVANLIIKNVAL